MTRPADHEMEHLVAQLIAQEVELVATTVNTERGLQEFQQRIEQHKRTRRRMYAVATLAAVIVLVVGGLAAARLTGGNDRSLQPAKPRPTAVPTQQTRLPAPAAPIDLRQIPGARVAGPEAYGAVWSGSPSGLYRISTDGRRVLSTTKLPGDASRFAPVPAGNAIVLPLSIGSSEAVAVVDGSGRLRGTVPMHISFEASGVVGDRTGAWVLTGPQEISRLDVNAVRFTRRISIPAVSLGGITGNGSALFASDIGGTGSGPGVLRIDPATGHVTARAAWHVLPNAPQRADAGAPAMLTYTAGALFVAGDDSTLRRLDPATLRETAGIGWPVDAYCFPDVGGFVDGALWVQPGSGLVAAVDPVSLRAIRTIQLFSRTRPGDCFGISVTGSRVFIGSGDNQALYSARLK